MTEGATDLGWTGELGDAVSWNRRDCVYHEVCLRHAEYRGCGDNEGSEMHVATAITGGAAIIHEKASGQKIRMIVLQWPSGILESEASWAMPSATSCLTLFASQLRVFVAEAEDQASRYEAGRAR
jgi:hypothetical protein